MSHKFSSPLGHTLPLDGPFQLNALAESGVSNRLAQQAEKAPSGYQVFWGLPFDIDKVHVIKNKPIKITLPAVKTRWLCFLHTAEEVPVSSAEPTHEEQFSYKNVPWSSDVLIERKKLGQTGYGLLNQLAATYVIEYADGTKAPYPIYYRQQINMAHMPWGHRCFQAVPHECPSVLTLEDKKPWGLKQRKYENADTLDSSPDHMLNWICAWQNPYPEKPIVSICLEPGNGPVLLSAITSCDTKETPIRWSSRQKLLLTLPKTITDNKDFHAQLLGNPSASHSEYMFMNEARNQLLNMDMGVVMSVVPRFSYDNDNWCKGEWNECGQLNDNEFIVEYSGHPEARLYTPGGDVIALAELQKLGKVSNIKVIPPQEQMVTLRVIDKEHRQPVSVRLHIHGQHSEYLAPVNRHRIPNSRPFEDYGPELTGANMHTSTYINGESTLKLPVGNIYLEVSKGFECKPLRKVITITPDTKDITLEIEKVLHWRKKGWVTADTHVHFISPATANLEGAAEGIHIVNLLATQWGELMANVGDFDGMRTFENREAGDPYFVRIGTENRQNILGHISLLGYQGPMITPLCAGGADEAAIGDPVDILLTEWAERCQQQGGLVVLPHYPAPRGENIAALVSGHVDAIEMHVFGRGIEPYALVNWYRCLNCGFQVPLTAGTDKMWAGRPIGLIRTYSQLSTAEELSYEGWMDSIRRGNTFVTLGPLLEFSVEGREAGSKIKLDKTGGRVTVTWKVETVIHSVTGIELIVNGEVCDGKAISQSRGEGYFEVNVNRSSWICILIRGKFSEKDKNEYVLAHSSAVMVDVAGSEFFSAVDAVSMLDQIEGSMAYLECLGTRAETQRYKEMRLKLEHAYNLLHNRLHKLGHDHSHDIGHKHH